MKNILVLVGISLTCAGVSLAQHSQPPRPVESQRSRMECGTLHTIDEYVRSYEHIAAFDGVVLIAEGDNVVYHCGYGLADYRFGTPLALDTRFRIASLSKQFTMASIGLLVSANGFSLDTSLSEFLPDFPSARRNHASATDRPHGGGSAHQQARLDGYAHTHESWRYHRRLVQRTPTV